MGVGASGAKHTLPFGGSSSRWAVQRVWAAVLDRGCLAGFIGMAPVHLGTQALVTLAGFRAGHRVPWWGFRLGAVEFPVGR